jgi:hypothetical protein
MWGFSEKEIEKRLTDPEKKERPLPIEVDDVRYVVLATQGGLISPEESKRNPQQPLFPELVPFPVRGFRKCNYLGNM